MKVYLNSMVGVDDACISLLMSKRSYTREKDIHIREIVNHITSINDWQKIIMDEKNVDFGHWPEFRGLMDKLVKWGVQHPTLLSFVDLSFTVEGLHRAGQDDWDAHAYRYQNRIIRASTRLATFKGNEMSDFYKGKIIPMDMALDEMDIKFPESFEKDGITYVRATNGYIREDMKDDKDVKRGLYMECIPSSFIFKCNLEQFAHVYKMRNVYTHANPEVKELAEQCADLIEDANPWFKRDLLMNIPN